MAATSRVILLHASGYVHVQRIWRHDRLDSVDPKGDYSRADVARVLGAKAEFYDCTALFKESLNLASQPNVVVYGDRSSDQKRKHLYAPRIRGNVLIVQLDDSGTTDLSETFIIPRPPPSASMLSPPHKKDKTATPILHVNKKKLTSKE